MIFEQNNDIPELSQIYVLFDYQLWLLLHTVSIDFRITFRYSKNKNSQKLVKINDTNRINNI